MRFSEFLTNISEGVDEAPSKRYHSPSEVLTREQWQAVSSDLDFLTFVHHPGQAGSVMVQPVASKRPIFNFTSTANLKHFVQFVVEKDGTIVSKTVFEKQKGRDERPNWVIKKHKTLG